MDPHPHTHPHESHGEDGHDHGTHMHEGGDPGSSRRVRLELDLLAKNNRIAERNRGWLEGRQTVALNLMSAPGSGKTTLLEQTIRDLGAELRLGVVEGDQETSRDAERIRQAGCPVVQINTGTGCHLDAEMLGSALRTLDPPPASLVFIENVGNLVCPALFDLGEKARVVISSVTEGEDKPMKYPHMFRASDLVVLNKMDLLPYVEFDVDRFLAHSRSVNPRVRVLPVSATRGDGLSAWYAWLRELGAPHARSAEMR
ncbi:MAG TPA: hydrogenase nickel incorporation protein HypB [Myxococcota bacterium]|nr:hydrogenase nickel incorporation protein HypB [Myxococcota bacterium]